MTAARPDHPAGLPDRARRPRGLRITVNKLRLVAATAAKYFGVELTDEQARSVILSDETLMEELKGRTSKHGMDTYTRDHLSMALIEVILPGPPTVLDAMIFRPMEHWHWPLNGSSHEYTRAFYRA